MSIKTHAMNEFMFAGWCDKEGEFSDPMQKSMCNDVLDLLEVFSSQGHSGSSASYAIDLFTKLVKFETITPITGEDSEWVEYAEGRFQNRRLSTVFKDFDRFNGQPYDMDAVVFWEYREVGGETVKTYFTSSDSRRPITFPYTKTTVYEEQKHEV